MYTIEEFDKLKTKVFKYITYKKRTESEIRTKFINDIEENTLDDIIEYFKEAGYIDDYSYVKKQIREYMLLKNMSIKEIKYKLEQKGINRRIIDDYIQANIEELEEYEKKSAENIRNKKRHTLQEEEINRYLYQKGYRIMKGY